MKNVYVAHPSEGRDCLMPLEAIGYEALGITLRQGPGR